MVSSHVPALVASIDTVHAQWFLVGYEDMERWLSSPLQIGSCRLSVGGVLALMTGGLVCVWTSIV